MPVTPIFLASTQNRRVSPQILRWHGVPRRGEDRIFEAATRQLCETHQVDAAPPVGITRHRVGAQSSRTRRADPASPPMQYAC
ncbi:MAG: hypothetical protein JWP57_4132 [Spirosoma sp.]|nr:hypothetical protein [Spirosoma sp.]